MISSFEDHFDVKLMCTSCARVSEEGPYSMPSVADFVRCIPRFEEYGVVYFHYFLAFQHTIPIVLVMQRNCSEIESGEFSVDTLGSGQPLHKNAV